MTTHRVVPAPDLLAIIADTSGTGPITLSIERVVAFAAPEFDIGSDDSGTPFTCLAESGWSSNDSIEAMVAPAEILDVFRRVAARFQRAEREIGEIYVRPWIDWDDVSEYITR